MRVALIKRLFDIIVATFVLIISAPFILFFSVAIKLDSPGPVFFCQCRVGKDQVNFPIIKFRTMHHRGTNQIDQLQERVITKGEDSRITRVGRFLRKTSLDELPQLVNVVKGDMSIVGPRPIIPEQLEVVFSEFTNRFDVKPGMTGLAVVRGRRSLNWVQQLECDSEYAENSNFLTDMGIIFRTVWIVLKGSGVYGDESGNWRNYRNK